MATNASAKGGIRSIKTKLLIVIIPIVVIAIIGLILISYNVSQQMIETTSESLLESSVSSQSAKISAWTNLNIGELSAIKKSIEISGYDDTTLQTVVNGYYGYDSNFSNGVYIATSDGTFLKAADSEETQTDPLNTVWYKHGITTVNMSLTAPYEDGDGEKIVSCSGMINDGSGKIRVIGADLSLDSITVIVNSSISMDGAESFLVNEDDGTILAHQNSDLIGTSLDTSNSDSFMAGVAEKMQNYDYTLAMIDGNMTEISEVGTTGWILVSFIPKSVIFADIEKLRTIMIIVGIIAILILGIVVERSVSYVIKPVSSLTRNIAEMSNGDFTIQIHHKGNDEVARMGVGLENFSNAMKGMIADIMQTSERLKNQSQRSSEVSSEMYTSAKIQSDSMDQLNSTVDQLSASVTDIAENATTLANVVADTRERSREADEKMMETVDISVKGKNEMQTVSTAMEEILSSMSSLEDAINKVGTSSEEITKIVGLIGEISDETNLLSLNASIEAARAGEAGKGFAVVASEIGKLAATSTESVNDISALISQIHDLVADAVRQASDSSKSIIDNGASIKQAVDTFDDIFNNIQITNTTIKEVLEKIEEVESVATSVAAISEEQAASSEEILATSATMVEHANHITENSQKVADDSVELEKTAKSLADHMNKFRIDKNGEV